MGKHTLEDALERARQRRLPLPTLAVRRARRVAAGLTEAELAAVIGVDRATVARWELGLREPRGDLRRRYGEALEELRRA